MKFEKGHKLAKGGKRNPPGGRPTKAQVAEKQAELRGLEKAKQILEEGLVADAEEIRDKYLELAKTDPAHNRHAVDKLVPDAKKAIEIDMEIGVANAGFARANQRAREAAEKRKK